MGVLRRKKLGVARGLEKMLLRIVKMDTELKMEGFLYIVINFLILQ